MYTHLRGGDAMILPSYWSHIEL